MKLYSRVSYEIRCQIFAYLQANLSIPEIAKELGFHKSTIYRELKKNSSSGGKYRPDIADRKSIRRGKTKGRKKALVGFKKRFTLKKLEQGWSPEMICKRFQLEKNESFSH